jgi:hypothetical protein
MASEWLQQWYVSGRRAGIINAVVIATDSEAFEWIEQRIGDHVIHVKDIVPLLKSKRWKDARRASKSGGASKNKAYSYRSIGYENIVVQRATILSKILHETSVNIIYADTDIHWFRNPLDLILNRYSHYHVCLQREKGNEVGDNNCSGFMYLRNTLKTQIFARAWESYIKTRLRKGGFFTDQDEMNHLLHDISNRNLPHKYSGLLGQFRPATFDWDEFPNGKNFFSERLIGEGRIDRSCFSKVCKETIWKPVESEKKKRKDKISNMFLVHHNYAKNNEIKIVRAKEFGLWLELDPDEW